MRMQSIERRPRLRWAHLSQVAQYAAQCIQPAFPNTSRWVSLVSTRSRFRLLTQWFSSLSNPERPSVPWRVTREISTNLQSHHKPPLVFLRERTDGFIVESDFIVHGSNVFPQNSSTFTWIVYCVADGSSCVLSNFPPTVDYGTIYACYFWESRPCPHSVWIFWVVYPLGDPIIH